MAQTLKSLPAIQETQVQSLSWKDPLEKETAPHFSIFAYEIPWTEEPGRLQSMGSQRVKHDWVTNTCTRARTHTHTHTHTPHMLIIYDNCKRCWRKPPKIVFKAACSSQFGLPRWPAKTGLPKQETQEMKVQSLSWEDPWRRNWQPTPVFLPGKSHRQRSPVDYNPWGCKELDVT